MRYEPPWLVVARGFIGLKEVKGPKHNSTIVDWLNELGAWWSNDEVPWCGILPAICFKRTGYDIPTYYMRAKAWVEWGVRIHNPVLGCVVVFDRAGGGHVGLVVGIDNKGNPWVLGGNQKDTVSIALFDRQRVIAYRLPKGWDYSRSLIAPLVMAKAEFSRNEA